MSSTTTTQYYGLSQYIGTDKPDWTDNNEAFREVDADLHEAVQSMEGFGTDIAALHEAQNAFTTEVRGLEADLNTEKAKIRALQNKETLQDAEIAGVKADALDMIEAKDEGTAQVATVAVAAGKYFRYNDVLYIATINIAVGDTIVPNTNCRATNVGTELEELKSDLANNNFTVIKSVTADGVKTWAALLDELGYPTGAKDCIETVYQNGATIFLPSQLVDVSGHHYVNTVHDTNQFKITELVVGAANARYSFVATSGGNTITDTSSTVPPSGMTISFVR